MRDGPLPGTKWTGARGEPAAELDVEADPDLHGVDDDAAEAEAELELSKDSGSLPTPTEEALALLSELRAVAEKARRRPDAKVRALLAWMREHQCPAVGTTDIHKTDSDERAWTDRRVIIFTEWGDTKRYLVELLGHAARNTDRAKHASSSSMGAWGTRPATRSSARSTQRAFNAPPDEHPVRILIATDAARE